MALIPHLLFVITLLTATAVKDASSQPGRVLLRDISALTLRRGVYTTGRRSTPVPQLKCVGGTAYGQYAPKIVQCYNRGHDGRDVQWECSAEMSKDYQFGKLDISCEGFDYPDDPYVLADSCGLNYELDYSASGAKRHSTYREPTAPFYEEETKINYTKLFYFLGAALVIYLIYTTLSSSNSRDRQERGGYGGGGDDDPRPDGRRPPPPGWNSQPPPSYDDTFGKPTAGTGAGSGTSRSGGGPGFFTGLGLGAVGGYLFGNRPGDNRDFYGGTRRRRGFFGTYQDPYYNTHTGGASHYDDQPSTSTGYRGSGGTHTSTSYGGTSRR